MKSTLTALLLTGSLLASPALAVDKAEVVKTYADIAEAGYSDSLATAKALQAAVDALITTPSAETLEAAKAAWLAARVPYQQTEVFRFGNAIVDDWEGFSSRARIDAEVVGETYSRERYARSLTDALGL